MTSPDGPSAWTLQDLQGNLHLMQRAVPSLAPILRSDVQGRILAELLIDPARELSSADLARRIGVSSSTISREIDRASLRFLDVDTLAAFLADAGFEVEAQFGGWLREPLGQTSPEIVTIARVR